MKMGVCLQAGDGRGQNQGDEPGDCVELFSRAARERFADGKAFCGHRAKSDGVRAVEKDFKPEEGGPDIFDKDPLIPMAWRGDWNLSVVLQDEASGAATGGVLYLTNIHRLFDNTRRKKEAETYDWMGRRCRNQRHWTPARNCATASPAIRA